jgi:KUP system potassium uptake protein
MTANPAPLPAGDRQPTNGSGEADEPPHRHHAEANPRGKRLLVLSLTALGVVYGDIGTSPLYAIKEAFKPEYGLTPNINNVYGLLSLIVWSLVMIVSVKYVAFILRADNRGEGGVLALLALILQRHHRQAESRRRGLLIALGLFGGAFLYGDGVITPAISVLGAVEGLEVASPALGLFVIPIAFIIIAVLFAAQRYGTARVGGLFGWIMLVWFATIAVLGLRSIVMHPEILAAVNPWYAVQFFVDHPARSFIALGAVVLVVTGGEALYADMGHFGPKPIRIVWYYFVLPALLLNYFGQGALLLSTPTAITNPFYLLSPSWFVYPLLVIATSAAIVASQALISGAFSLTQQAIQLGYSPRMRIIHTSKHAAGQIYIPEINKALAIGTLLLVVGFGSSTALGAAYGVAVTGTMAITSILFYIVTRNLWGWSPLKAGAFLAFFLTIDLAFFTSNLLKIPHGGWVPLAIAIFVFVLMTTWKRGRAILRAILQRGTVPIDMFLADVERRKPVRVKGTAVFMTSDPEGAPVVLLHHLKHNKVLHEQVVLLSVITAEVPEVPSNERIELAALGQGFFRVQASYGFMETPNVPAVLQYCGKHGINAKKTDVSYYLGRERLLPTLPRRAKDTEIGTMARWRKKLFVLMSQNARGATEFFGIPPNRVVELGTQIEF